MNEWCLLIVFTFLSFIALFMAIYPLRKTKGLSFWLIPLLVLSIFLSYGRWGSWSLWRAYLTQNEQQKRVAAVLQTIKSPQELISRMKAKVKENPRNAKGWYLLGRLYASQNDWGLARDAFLKAHQLDPKEVGAVLNYAQSLWQLNNQVFNEEVRTLLTDLLEEHPQDPDALSMLAMDAFAQHDYQQAINYWQRLQAIVPAQSKEAEMIRKAIAKAEQAFQ